jgi:hypothetical protein
MTFPLFCRVKTSNICMMEHELGLVDTKVIGFLT